MTKNVIFKISLKLFFIFVSLILFNYAYGDDIHLNDGRTLVGKVLDQDDKVVTFALGSKGTVTIKLQKSDIKDIVTKPLLSEVKSAPAEPNAILKAKELCITYDIKSKQVTESKDGKKEEKNSNSQITVGLGNSYLYIAEGNNNLIFDFKKSRIISIDGINKSYSDTSIFIHIGFRYMEFQNRLFLRDVLNKALEKSEKNEPPPLAGIFDIESMFAIEKPGANEVSITENKRGDNYEYSFNNKIVVECKLSNNSLNNTEKSLFEKYLIYHCYLHPQIRKKIISKNQIPQYLMYSYKDIGMTTSVELNLVKVALAQRDSYAIPLDYTKVYNTNSEELSSIIYNVISGKSSIKRTEKADFIKIADELKSKGSYFDAMLALLECGLQTGEDSPEKMKEVMSSGGESDERLQVFLKNVGNRKDKESTEKALKGLESINREGLMRGYVIDIMIGDGQMSLGDYKKAEESFLKALKANPYITGVYKDLGDLFNSSYDTVSAWQCWDTARFLYPDHEMLQQINEYEKWLTKNYPDFFL